MAGATCGQPSESRSWHLCRKGTAAATIARRIRILEDESLPHKRVFVLERRSIQVQKALGIDKDSRAELFEDFVAVTRLCIQPHCVGKSGAATALHADTQSTDFRRHAVLFEQLANFLRRL